MPQKAQVNLFLQFLIPLPSYIFFLVQPSYIIRTRAGRYDLFFLEEDGFDLYISI